MGLADLPNQEVALPPPLHGFHALALRSISGVPIVRRTRHESMQATLHSAVCAPACAKRSSPLFLGPTHGVVCAAAPRLARPHHQLIFRLWSLGRGWRCEHSAGCTGRKIFLQGFQNWLDPGRICQLFTRFPVLGRLQARTGATAVRMAQILSGFGAATRHPPAQPGLCWKPPPLCK